MAVVKVIEIIAESPESWEAAVQDAVTEAAKTVENLQTVYVKNLQAVLEGSKIVKYRANVKISFIVNK
ncbi:MAG: dodecin family protein [Clostridiaceae bacterium]